MLDGYQVPSFGKPSAEALDHDFLWRTARRLPKSGRVGIWPQRMEPIREHERRPGRNGTILMRKPLESE